MSLEFAANYAASSMQTGCADATVVWDKKNHQLVEFNPKSITTRLRGSVDGKLTYLTIDSQDVDTHESTVKIYAFSLSLLKGRPFVEVIRADSKLSLKYPKLNRFANTLGFCKLSSQLQQSLNNYYAQSSHTPIWEQNYMQA
ncbi:MAG: hypothetical protein ACPGUD_02335 [Parashewanella sp.]